MDEADGQMTDLQSPDEKGQAPSDFFVAGGTLEPDVRSYVKRPADDELFNLAMAGEFSHVLTTRQMGKSSLMIRTAGRLQDKKIRTAIIDLTETGTTKSVDTWYLDLLTELADQLDLSEDVETWWQVRSSLGQVRRFVNFMRDVVLADVEERVVIFIDEIDKTLRLEFRDDFFAAIRAIYNARASRPEFKRLTFVLLGVASPPDLIKDPALTPYNIGQGIELEEFSRADAMVLQEGLEAAYPGEGEAIFARIHHWTDGHPYLTQKLCLAAVEAGNGGWTDQRLDELVEKELLSEKTRKEGNLKFVQDRTVAYPKRRKLFNLYKKVLEGEKIREDAQSPEHNYLKLSGLVKAENGYLRVRNRIYQRVFGLDWVKEYTPINWMPILVAIAGIAVVVALLAVGAILYNGWVDMQVDNAELHFRRVRHPGERLVDLAEIFKSRQLLGSEDYGRRARELFYGLPEEEQEELFGPPATNESDLVVVIEGLYWTLADVGTLVDVDGPNGTTRLLEAMRDGLDQYDLKEGSSALDLYEEIRYWLDGRSGARLLDYEYAKGEYTKALEKNPKNPATLYERARVLIRLSEPDYPASLNDLENVIAIARESGEFSLPTAEAPTGTPTSTSTQTPIPTPTATTTPAGVSPAPARATLVATPSGTLTLLPPITPSSTPTGTLEPALSATPTPTTAPTPTPTKPPDVISPKFITFLDIRDAVRQLIYANPGLVELLLSAASSEYTNLRESGLILTPTPWPTDTPTPTPAPVSAMRSIRCIHGAAGVVAPPVDLWDYWIAELNAMGMTWYKQLDNGDPNDVGPSSTFAWARELKRNGIEPIISYYQPEQFPDSLPDHHFEKMELYAAEGIVWAEIGSEPNLRLMWKSPWQNQDNDVPMQHNNPEVIRIIAETWIRDARKALDAGVRPAFYAFAPTDWAGASHPLESSVFFTQKVVGYLAENHRVETVDIFQRGGWIAVHAATYEQPFGFDPFGQGDVVWDLTLRSYEVVLTAFRDHFGDELDVDNLVVISTQGGVFTPDSSYMFGHARLASDEEHAQHTVEMFDWLEQNSPLHAMCPWLISNGPSIGHLDQRYIYDGWYDEVNGTIVPKPVVQAMKESSRLEVPIPTLDIGSTMTRVRDGAEMVYVPGGTFQIGSAAGDDDEQPVHSVTLNSFWIDKYEVTNTQYKQCVDAGACEPPTRCDWGDPTYGDESKADHPVVCANWHDAQAFCSWAGARLPSEAEWEYAARGPQGNTYPWGDAEPTCGLAQFGECSGQTVPVGSFPDGASWCTALDMAGNVWEWVADWYQSNYYSVSPPSDPPGPEVGNAKVLRGGSWFNVADSVRSAYRDRDEPVNSSNNYGFRCVGAATP